MGVDEFKEVPGVWINEKTKEIVESKHPQAKSAELYSEWIEGGVKWRKVIIVDGEMNGCWYCEDRFSGKQRYKRFAYGSCPRCDACHEAIIRYEDGDFIQDCLGFADVYELYCAISRHEKQHKATRLMLAQLKKKEDYIFNRTKRMGSFCDKHSPLDVMGDKVSEEEEVYRWIDLKE